MKYVVNRLMSSILANMMYWDAGVINQVRTLVQFLKRFL